MIYRKMVFTDGIRWLDYSIAVFLVIFALCSTVSVVGARNAMFLLLALGAVRYLISPFVLPPISLAVRGIVLFFLTLGIASLFSVNPTQSIRSFGIYAIQVIPFILSYVFIKTRQQAYWLLGALGLSLLANDIYSIDQYFHDLSRPQGFSPNYMVLASFLVQLLPLFLVLSFENASMPRWLKFFCRVVFGASLLGLIANNTRGAWISIAAVISVYVCLTTAGKKKVLLYLLLSFILLGFLACGVPTVYDRFLSIFDLNYQSNSERLLIWQGVSQMIVDHPLLGVGLGNFYGIYHSEYISPLAKEPQSHVHAHNLFLQIAVEAGLLGLAAFLFMIFSFLATGYCLLKNSSQSLWGLMIMLFFVSFLVQGFTEYNFGHIPAMRLFWFITGMFIGADNRIDAKPVG